MYLPCSVHTPVVCLAHETPFSLPFTKLWLSSSLVSWVLSSLLLFFFKWMLQLTWLF